jgi:succinate dehydrogenase flavin-adding protein (antitoxin of CptAB toxin-antitoxin module)
MTTAKHRATGEKNRLEFESDRGARAEALIIIKIHRRNYEAARNEVKLVSFVILILPQSYS